MLKWIRNWYHICLKVTFSQITCDFWSECIYLLTVNHYMLVWWIYEIFKSSIYCICFIKNDWKDKIIRNCLGLECSRSFVNLKKLMYNYSLLTNLSSVSELFHQFSGGDDSYEEHISQGHSSTSDPTQTKAWPHCKDQA